MTELKEKIEEGIFKIIFATLFGIIIASAGIIFITLLKTLFQIL